MRLLIEGLAQPTPRQLDEWASRRATPEARQEAEDAIACIRRFVGDGWLDRPTPFSGVMFTGFQGREPELVRLFQLLSPLLEEPHLAPLVRDLTGSSEAAFHSACAVLEVLGAFVQRVEVEILPRTHVAGADYRLRLDERWLTVESTGLREDAASVHVTELHRDLDRWGREQGILSVGMAVVDFHGSLEEAELAMPLVKEGITSLLATGEFDRIIQVEGRTTVQLVRERTGPWSVMTSGPTTETYFGTAGRAMTRLLRAIRHKRRQVVADGPAIIYVEPNNLLWNHRRSREMQLGEVAARVAASLLEAPEVSGVVVCEKWLDAAEVAEHFQHDLYTACWGTCADGYVRVVMLVPNPEARHPLSDRERAAWVGPGMLW
jgi:hypothetical protein